MDSDELRQRRIERLAALARSQASAQPPQSTGQAGTAGTAAPQATPQAAPKATPQVPPQATPTPPQAPSAAVPPTPSVQNPPPLSETLGSDAPRPRPAKQRPPARPRKDAISTVLDISADHDGLSWPDFIAQELDGVLWSELLGPRQPLAYLAEVWDRSHAVRRESPEAGAALQQHVATMAYISATAAPNDEIFDAWAPALLKLAQAGRLPADLVLAVLREAEGDELRGLVADVAALATCLEFGHPDTAPLFRVWDAVLATPAAALIALELPPLPLRAAPNAAATANVRPAVAQVDASFLGRVLGLGVADGLHALHGERLVDAEVAEAAELAAQARPVSELVERLQFELVNKLVRLGPEPRQAVLAWFVRALDANHAQLATNRVPGAANSLQLVLSAFKVLLKLSAPFTRVDEGAAVLRVQLAKVGADYFRHAASYDVSDETKLLAAEQAPFNSRADPALPSFVTQLLFLTGGFLQFGFHAAAEALAGSLERNVEYVQAQLAALPTDPHFVQMQPTMRAMMLMRWRTLVKQLKSEVGGVTALMRDVQFLGGTLRFAEFLLAFMQATATAGATEGSAGGATTAATEGATGGSTGGAAATEGATAGTAGATAGSATGTEVASGSTSATAGSTSSVSNASHASNSSSTSGAAGAAGAASIADAFAAFPELLLDAPVASASFVLRAPEFVRAPTPGSGHALLFDAASFFMSSPHVVRNPYLRSKFVELLFYGGADIPLTNGTTVPGPLSALFTTDTCREHVLPALMAVFIDIEHTGRTSQFFEKFTTRQYVAHVIQVIWRDPHYRRQLEAESREKPDFFVKFVALLLNDATYLLDEALGKLLQVKKLEAASAGEASNANSGAASVGNATQVNSNEGNANEGNANEGNANEGNEGNADANDSGSDEPESSESSESSESPASRLASAERMARQYLRLSASTVTLLHTFTSTVPAIFATPEIIDRFAVMLNYNLAALVGPRCHELKVRNAASLGFHPRQLLADLVQVYLNLRTQAAFPKAIAKDERSYSHGLMQRTRTILRKYNLLSPVDLEHFETLTTAARAAWEEAQAEEEEFGDEVPDEYLDPLMYTLMENPVVLPTSKVTIDLSTIKTHLLSDPTDPFNRVPLKIEDVVPNDALRGEIAEFRRKKREARSAGGDVAGDVEMADA